MDKENLKYYNKKWYKRYSRLIRIQDPLIVLAIAELFIGIFIVFGITLTLQLIVPYIGQSSAKLGVRLVTILYGTILALTFAAIPITASAKIYLERKGLISDQAVKYHLYKITVSDDYKEKWKEFAKISKIVSRPGSGIGEKEATSISNFYNSVKRTNDQEEIEKKKKELLPKFVDQIIIQKSNFDTKRLSEIIEKSRESARDPLSVRIKDKFSGRKSGKVVEYLVNYRIAFSRILLSLVAVIYLQFIDIYSPLVVGLLVILIANPKRVLGMLSTIKSEIKSLEEQT